MPQRSNEFQRLVFMLHSQLHDQAKVTESAMVPSRIDGLEQEVDVLIEERSGQYSMLIGVEVRARKRPASIEWVDEAYGKHQFRTDKLVLVSKSGFTSNAQSVAARRGITTMSLADAMELDWESEIGKLKELFLGRFSFRIDRGYVIFAEETGIAEELEVSPTTLLHPENGQKPEAIQKIANLILEDPKTARQLMDLIYANQDRDRINTTFDVVPTGYLIDTEGRTWKVRAIRLEVHCDLKMTQMPMRQGRIGSVEVAWGEIDGENDRMMLLSSKQYGKPSRTTLRLINIEDGTEQVVEFNNHDSKNNGGPTPG